MERLIVLDTETTGIEPSEGHRIIEIGCTEIIDRKIIEGNEYQQYIQPGNQKVGDSKKIHNLSDSFLKDKPKFEEIAKEFLEYIEGATLVIHNAPFDLGFLNNELKLMGLDTTIEDYCPDIKDSLVEAREKFPGSMNSLDALCRRFKVDSSSRTVHGALIDVKILAEVWLAMTGGQSTLFSENNNEDNKRSEENSIIRVNEDRAKIKIVLANEAELEAHNTYFE